MQYIPLRDIMDSNEVLKSGTITLVGSTGKRYVNKALNIPGYGWVPCSVKLCKNWSATAKDLQLNISEPGDKRETVTSDIWVTRTLPSLKDLIRK